MAYSGNTGTGSGSPCGACKFLRRKCASDCIFAPYFSTEQGPARFAAIHKVFGASNVSKLLLNVPVHDRCEAVVSIAYEAQARLSDPVYGCVAHIFALQQQVAFLQAQVMQLKAQVAQHNLATPTTDLRNLTELTSGFPISSSTPYNPYGHKNPNPVSPQSSIESFDQSNTSSDVTNMQEIQSNGYDDYYYGYGFHEGYPNKKRLVTQCNNDLSELQTLALRMMRN